MATPFIVVVAMLFAALVVAPFAMLFTLIFSHAARTEHIVIPCWEGMGALDRMGDWAGLTDGAGPRRPPN